MRKFKFVFVCLVMLTTQSVYATGGEKKVSVNVNKPMTETEKMIAREDSENLLDLIHEIKSSKIATRGIVTGIEGEYRIWKDPYFFSTNHRYGRDVQRGDFDQLALKTVFVGGTNIGKASDVMAKTVQAAHSILSGGINKKYYNCVETEYSYASLFREAQIFTNGQWKTYFMFEEKHKFYHNISRYKNQYSGLPVTAAYDFTYDTGYPAISIKYSPNYFDLEWIENETRISHYLNRKLYVEFAN